MKTMGTVRNVSSKDVWIALPTLLAKSATKRKIISLKMGYASCVTSKGVWIALPTLLVKPVIKLGISSSKAKSASCATWWDASIV